MAILTSPIASGTARTLFLYLAITNSSMAIAHCVVLAAVTHLMENNVQAKKWILLETILAIPIFFVIAAVSGYIYRYGTSSMECRKIRRRCSWHTSGTECTKTRSKIRESNGTAITAGSNDTAAAAKMIAKGLTGTKQPVSTFPGTRTHTQTEKPLGNRAMGVYRDKPFPRTLTDEEKRVELFREQYRESIKNRIVPPAHALNSIKSRYPNQVEVLSSRPNSSVPLDPEEEHSQVLAELQRQLGISPKETLVQAPTHLIRIQDLVTDDEENEGFLGSGSGAVNVVPSRSIPESGAEVMGRKVPLGPSLRQLTNRCPLYGDCCGNDDVEEAGIPHPPYLRDQPRSHTPPA